MPKNFQISQYDEPLCFDGYLDVEVDGKTVRIEIERVHLEEDTGKSAARGRRHRPHPRRRLVARRLQPRRHPAGGDRHQADPGHRRARARGGQGLRHRAARGHAHARRLRRADGAGLDALRREHLAHAARRAEWGTRTETKNVNSLRSVERAVRSRDACARRRSSPTAAGSSRRPATSTRTPAPPRPGRSKEKAQDYRYFPEPDLVPIAPDAAWVEELKAALPELPPRAPRKRLQQEWGVSDLDMQAMLNAGAVELIEATVAAGAPPARRPQVVDGRAVPPRQRARRRAGRAADHPGPGRRAAASWSTRATLNDKLARAGAGGRADR